MLGIFQWITGFLIAILIAGFAALNRQDIDFYYSPIHDPAHYPLYFIVLAFTVFGFLTGALIVWVQDGKIRKDKRIQKKQIKTLENELRKSEAVIEAHKIPENSLFPSLPHHKN